MEIDIHNLIGEATAYDKKQLVEAKRPKSWLKSVSAFANGEGGVLVFGISDNGEIIGLQHAEEDGETISECIKTKLDPIPTIELEYRLVGEKLLSSKHSQMPFISGAFKICFLAGWSNDEMPALILLSILRFATLLLTEGSGNIGLTGKSFADNSRTFVNYANYRKYLHPLDSLRIMRF